MNMWAQELLEWELQLISFDVLKIKDYSIIK
jgi:hypothetical protein